MYQSYQQPQTANKSTIDSQLFVNCTFDMDYLEITKNESLRKYEENVYLLGSIFAQKVKNSLNEESSESESDEDSFEQEEEILNLFKNQSKSQENDFNQILEKLKNENCDEKTKILLAQLDLSQRDLKEHQILLQNNQNNFKHTLSKKNLKANR